MWGRVRVKIFRVAVMDAYARACAVTHEHSLPALEASHIQPYAKNGPHDVRNGILLRADLHRLFDQGYVTTNAGTFPAAPANGRLEDGQAVLALLRREGPYAVWLRLAETYEAAEWEKMSGLAASVAISPSRAAIVSGSVSSACFLIAVNELNEFAVGPVCDVDGAVNELDDDEALNRLLFPQEFVGRGDMSRGGLLLRCAASGEPLTYVPLAGAIRKGVRPPRLDPATRVKLA